MANLARLFTSIRVEQDRGLDLDGAGNRRARARARLLQAVDQEPSKLAVKPAEPDLRPWRWGLAAGLGVGLAAGLAVTIMLIMLIMSTNLNTPAPTNTSVARVAEHLASETLTGGDPATLEFVQDGLVLDADQVVAAGPQPESIEVSDSTTIELGAGSQMYVDAIRPNGASIVLDHGTIALAVHHEQDTSWEVAAGPWTVRVTGTEFAVTWDPSTEKFRVSVVEGSVRVEGPGNEVVELGAGDELVRPDTELASLELDSIDSSPSVTGSNPSILEEPLGKPSPSKTKSKWRQHFAAADYRAAWNSLADQPGGIHAEAARARDAETMLDLADVARFTKHPSDTSKLLERLRERFPNTKLAGDAAFTLGRLAADGGSHDHAADWFERYLDERPNGSFAGDALGRLIDCYDALGKDDDAAAAAKRYLADHAKGPHASKAERILGR